MLGLHLSRQHFWPSRRRCWLTKLCSMQPSSGPSLVLIGFQLAGSQCVSLFSCFLLGLSLGFFFCSSVFLFSSCFFCFLIGFLRFLVGLQLAGSQLFLVFLLHVVFSCVLFISDFYDSHEAKFVFVYC